MTNSGPQLTPQPPVEIAIVRYPGAQATTVHGLTDLFYYADHFARLHAATMQPVLRVKHWEQDQKNGQVTCSFDSNPGYADHEPSLVLVPASQLAPMAPDCAPHSVAWVRERHAQGAVVAAVCGGVFLLAESGLLNGRRATTHWMFAEELSRRFPEIRVDADRLVIDDGDIITAGGVLAWADLGLSLVEKLLGPMVMATTARFMIVDPPGREQRVYRDFLPRLQHGDRAILAVQHWLQGSMSSDIGIRQLAERAGMGERTFLRRFVKATGIKPGEYHQHLRITRGRELLEFTRHNVGQIAALAGYEDVGGFRKAFKRLVGLSPREYRQRFQRSAVGG